MMVYSIINSTSINISRTHLTNAGLHGRKLSSSTSLYKHLQDLLPLTTNERTLVNNAIVGLLNDSIWTLELSKRNIPPFIIRNLDFRTNFLDYLDRRGKYFVRNNIDSFKAISSTALDQCYFVHNELSNGLLSHLLDFVKFHMPQLLITYNNIKHIVDIRYPEREFSEDRPCRHVIAHVGPPNSGKTYDAYRRLTKSSTGIYCSPLRLLAWEMQRKLSESNVPCALLTGQERITTNTETHLSCTVEMVPLNNVYDCAIIDEMQMIGDLVRGYAWTRVFLGLKAKEIHICGNESCLPLAVHLTNACGDVLEIKKHKRLNQLVLLDKEISIEELKPGDCLVCFSRRDVFALREKIESTKYSWNDTEELKTSIVYGSLPPEVRCDQIKNFNERKTQILISSDAIGMGVNVRIRRILFYSLRKYDGNVKRTLTGSEVQQISGRAGRYSMDCGHGQVGCLQAHDTKLLKKLILEPQPSILKAVIAPPVSVIEAFSTSITDIAGNTKFSDSIKLLFSMAKTSETFELCDCSQLNRIAKMLHGVELPTSVLIEYLFVPLGTGVLPALVLRTFASSHSILNSVKLKNILTEESISGGQFEITGSDENVKDTHTHFKTLELLYQVTEIYLWLSVKFPSVYVDKDAATTIKTQIANTISEYLEHPFDITECAKESDICEDESELWKGLIRQEFMEINCV